MCSVSTVPAHVISEPAEYVMNQLVESVLGKDKAFVG
jgi:hypothetical protein